MNITALYNDFHEKSGRQRDNFNDIVAASLLHIIGHYFVEWSSSLVLTLSCHREHTCTFYNDMMNRLFDKWNEWPLQIVNVQQCGGKRIKANRRYNMVLVDSYKSFVEADLSSYANQNDYQEFYYIFLQNRDYLLPMDMQNIFEYCWRNYLINCVVQTQNAKGEILLYTYFPYTERYCGKVEVVLINQYKGLALVHKELFPPKLNNFHGCPLRAALWHIPPYVFLTNDTSGQYQITGGFEGMLLLELSRKLNFKVDIKVPADNLQWGDVFENGTLTGALRMLYNREVDLSVGSFRQNSERSAVVTPSINYYQSSISLVSLEAIYRLNSLETLQHPFQQQTWLVLCAFFIFAVVIQRIVGYVHRSVLGKLSRRSSLDVLLVFLGMPGACKPKKIATRIMNVSWTFFGLIIRGIYQGYLFQMIRNHVTADVPENLEALLQRKYTLVVNRQTDYYLEEFSSEETIDMLVLNSTARNAAIHYLRKRPLEEVQNLVAVMPIDHILYYIQVTRRLELFRIFPYSVMKFKTCIYMTKHSYLVEKVDEILELFKVSGLLQCWLNRILEKHYFKNSLLPEDHLIGMWELYSVFLAVFCSHVLATMIFVAEIVHKRYKARR